MCDTVLAMPGSTAEQVMLFGKNSDRPRNEAQAVEYFPRAMHAPDATLKCTYITIPQVVRTRAVLLCRPFWMWGAEMGANEHGVVAGNEALHARSPPPETPALIGMDLLRLALERASTAAEAVNVITALLERHGQGGNCGYLNPVFYDNGFMVADSSEAFVLETVGREWLVERVGGVRAISNRYSIGRAAERVSAGLTALIRDSGWSTKSELDYADAIADPHREHIGNAGARRLRSTALLNSREGRLDVRDMASLLRDHDTDEYHGHHWQAESAVRRTICMHAGAEDRAGQTVGSMISELGRSNAVHWVTGSAAPCVSIFKPVLMDVPVPSHGRSPTDRFDPNIFWWRHERVHRQALMSDFAEFIERIRSERDALESTFRTRVNAVLDGGSPSERSQVVTACWREAMEMEDRWRTRLHGGASANSTPYFIEWQKMNRLAGLEGC